MKETSSKADFSAFTKIAQNYKQQKSKEAKTLINSDSQSLGYRYLQVRLNIKDANRLKAMIASKGFLVQSVLVEAINRWMQDQGQPPVVDPGTTRKNP